MAKEKNPKGEPVQKTEKDLAGEKEKKEKRERRNDRDFPLLMNQKEAAECVGVAVNTFAAQIQCLDGFPIVLKGTLQVFPRDPVIKWMSENWELMKR